ncbi:MAG: Rossmann-like and DUF2520 domain-containing protein [Thermodesulfobacteriota bacterium]
MNPSFAIVGCGKVGNALGKFLTVAGYVAVGAASKSCSSARKAAELFKTGRYSEVPWEITPAADVVLITTPDGAIAETCRLIAANSGFKTGGVVLHCSGALPSTILAPAGRCGAFTGSMHPLQSFAADDFPRSPFEGILIAVEGEPRALAVARQMAADLGAAPLTIKTEAKTLYHAAAVAASNYLVTLLELAFRLLADAGISGPEAYNALRPLIQGTLANIASVGIPQALTGPIARGDIETVKRHLLEIQARRPELSALFKALSFHTIDIAAAKGTLAEADAAALRNLLANAP